MNFETMDYTLNIVSKCRFFFIFKHSRAPKRSWKIFHGGTGKSCISLSVKEWEPCSESIECSVSVCCQQTAYTSLRLLAFWVDQTPLSAFWVARTPMSTSVLTFNTAVLTQWLAVWCSGSTLVSINAVALHRARLVLGWVTAFGQVKCLIT